MLRRTLLGLLTRNDVFVISIQGKIYEMNRIDKKILFICYRLQMNDIFSYKLQCMGENNGKCTPEMENDGKTMSIMVMAPHCFLV